MKNTTRIISSAICLFVATMPLCGFAGDINCSLNGRSISLSGNVESDDKYVSGIILPQNKYDDKISKEDIIGENVLAFSALKNEKSFSKKFGLPEEFKAGEYVVCVFENNKKIIKNFVYCGDALDELSAQMGNMSAEQIHFAVSENKDLLGLDEKQCVAFASFIADSGKFLEEAYVEAYVVSIIKSGDTESAIGRYGYMFGIDYEWDFEKLKSSVKLSLDKMLKSEKITDINSDYHRLLKEAVLLNIETKEELKDLVLKEDMNFDDYNTLSESGKNKVINKLFNNLPESMEKLKADFEKYCADEASDDSSGSGSGGGSSGSGSSGGKNSGGAMSGSSLGTVSGIRDVQTVFSFDDISVHWAKEYIETLSSKQIISGYENGMFYPDKNVTRAEFSKMIALATGIQPDTTSASAFYDVADTDWYKPYVTAMAKIGIINGYNGFFNPDDYITREDMAVIIYRVLERKGYAMNYKGEFADMSVASDYASEAISKLGGSKIITGSENKFRPKDMSTRAETATVLAKILTAF